MNINDILMTHIIFCVNINTWVGEEETHDGCVAFLGRQVQRGKATLQIVYNKVEKDCQM